LNVTGSSLPSRSFLLYHILLKNKQKPPGSWCRREVLSKR